MKEDGSFYGTFSFGRSYVVFGDVVDGEFIISREVVESTEAPQADCSAVENQLGECQSGRTSDQEQCGSEKESLQNALDDADRPYENYYLEQPETSSENS